jgi:hypothetical protein
MTAGPRWLRPFDFHGISSLRLTAWQRNDSALTAGRRSTQRSSLCLRDLPDVLVFHFFGAAGKIPTQRRQESRQGAKEPAADSEILLAL